MYKRENFDLPITIEQKYNIDHNMILSEDLFRLSDDEIKEYFDIKSYFCFDTESCNTNEVVKDVKKDPVKVYAWALSNVKSDKVIYGTHLKDFIPTIEYIVKRSGVGSDSKTVKIDCFVHNLKWDLEFLKYVLLDEGYRYHRQSVTQSKRLNTLEVQPKGTYNITANSGNVYSAKISSKNPLEFKLSTHKGKKTKEVNIEINLKDSLKIMNKSLGVIAKDVISIDEMYYKLDEEYNYTDFRPDGHVLTDFEKVYLYNDVYILKEFIKQFYLPLNTTQTTASGIAFESYLEIIYKQGSLYENYKLFTLDYPDLTNNAVIHDAIRNSCRGGWTQVNRRFLGELLSFEKAVSIDINSSYPYVVAYMPLPYGKPRYCYREVSKEECKALGYDLRLMKVNFDGFKNKDEDNLIGEFTLKDPLLLAELQMYGIKDIDLNEYIDTNIINNKALGSSKNRGGGVGTESFTGNRRYSIWIWDFELESILKNTDLYLAEIKPNSLGIMVNSGTNLKIGYEVSDTLLFKARIGHFADAVNYYDKQKRSAKKKGNKALYEQAKLMNNSFTGKMATNPARSSSVEVINEEGLLSFKVESKIDYESSRKYYPAFYSAVTAWGRVNLRETLYEIGYNNVLYFDTDSLYTTLTAKELKAKIGHKIHKDKLGYWDIELEYNLFKALGRKQYMIFGKKYKDKGKEYTTKVKCSGMPKDLADIITFEEFKHGKVFKGKKQSLAVPYGYRIVETDFTLHKVGELITNTEILGE